MSTKDVKAFVIRRLSKISALPDNMRRAELARLRRGIGHAPGEIPELWGSFLTDMPDAFRGNNEPSYEEWAIYLTLTHYALHQQGKDIPMNCEGKSLGRAVRELADLSVSPGQDWTESSILSRFNKLITATEITEISNHLRGMIQLLRNAPNGGVSLDYPQLAADLYLLQCDDPRYESVPANVKLKWGQDLYRNKESNTFEKGE